MLGGTHAFSPEKLVLKYIELKSGYNDDGPAWIGSVKQSKSGRTLYFDGKAFKSLDGEGISGNYFDIETRDEYWISGIKKDGSDRHWAGSGPVTIEASAVKEYLAIVGKSKLDPKRFVVSDQIQPTDPAKFHELENHKL